MKQVAEGSDDGRGPGSYAGTSSTVPSSAQAMMNNVQPGARNVKRIFFLGDEGNPELEEFQISNVTTGDESWCRAISRKRCACLSCAIDPYSTDAVSDDDWFSHLSSEVAYSDPAIHDELSVEIFSEGDEDLKEIKPVYESYDLTMDDQAGSQVWEDPCSDMLQIEIGLDSGADISVMPFSFESYGSETFSGGVTRLRDAQGNLMKHGKTKRVTLDCGDSTLVENFTMCSVATPLLALGKMIRQGWNFQKEDHSLFLVKDGAQIPVKVRGNALSISAHVKRVQADFLDHGRNHFEESSQCGQMFQIPTLGLAGWRLRCRAGAAGMWRTRYRSLRCRAGMCSKAQVALVLLKCLGLETGTNHFLVAARVEFGTGNRHVPFFRVAPRGVPRGVRNWKQACPVFSELPRVEFRVEFSILG